MYGLPSSPPLDPFVPGQPVTVAALNALGSAARRLRISGGRGIRVREAGPDGVVIEAELPASGSPGMRRPVLGASTSSGDPSAGIAVALYANGPGSASTGSGTAFLPECIAGSSVPSGMWLVCWPGLVIETGGSEQ